MDQMKIDIDLSPNVLDLLTIVPKSETRSKGMPHVKRFVDSVGLSASS